MIVQLEKTADHISDWIKEYADNAGIKSLIVGLSGGIDSALVALLCKQTLIPTICVGLPCDSSSVASNADAFAKEFGGF